jgi:hypothetical protein
MSSDVQILSPNEMKYQEKMKSITKRLDNIITKRYKYLIVIFIFC